MRGNLKKAIMNNRKILNNLHTHTQERQTGRKEEVRGKEGGGKKEREKERERVHMFLSWKIYLFVTADTRLRSPKIFRGPEKGLIF